MGTEETEHSKCNDGDGLHQDTTSVSRIYSYFYIVGRVLLEVA